MKIVVVGANGQLGTQVVRRLSTKYQVTALCSKELDIGNESRVLECIGYNKPQCIINCAAYNNVNQAEIFKENAKYVNEIGTYNLAKAAEMVKAQMIHISTDYVFDGCKGRPYIEDDQPNPINYYGLTKYRGEQLIEEVCSQYIIIRTAWLYSDKENNFVHTVMRIAKEKGHMRVIRDHVGTPTNAVELANVIEKLIENGGQGIYHCTGQGSCSWYEFAKEIVRLNRIDCMIEPILSKDYIENAKKPAFSVLDNLKLRDTIGDPMKEWRESLKEHFSKNIK